MTEPFGPKVLGGFITKDETRYRKDGSAYTHTLYYCPHCIDSLFTHKIVSVPHGETDNDYTWGPGWPTTRYECNVCGLWSGPWISSEFVGGY